MTLIYGASAPSSRMNHGFFRFMIIYIYIWPSLSPSPAWGAQREQSKKILNQADVALVAQQACAAMDELQKASLAVAPAKLFDEFATKRISFDMFGMRF